MSRIPAAAIIPLLAATLGAGITQAEQPVGLILENSGGVVLRPGRETPIDAQAGVELFASDKIVAGDSGILFAFCPTASAQMLPPHQEVIVDAASLPALVTARKPLPVCQLPPMSRLGIAALTPRPSITAEGSLEERIARLAESTQVNFRKQWDILEHASHDWELLTAVSRVAVLESAGLAADAVSQCDRIAAKWPAATWTREVALRIARQQPGSRGVIVNQAARLPPGLQGKTYALLLGISRYRSVPSLNYADKDAEAFAAYLEMPRGGGLRLCPEDRATDCEIRLIENEQATLARVSSEFESFVGRDDHAQPANTLMVFIAAHGADPAIEKDWAHNTHIRKEPVILTWDSDYNEAKVSGYLMSELRDLVARFALRYGRVLVFVDVCRAGNIGPIAGTSEQQEAVREVFQDRKGNLGLFMASQAGDDAYESEKFGGGHGAFTYFLLDGLNQSPPGQQQLRFVDLKRFIEDGVDRVTEGRQIPDSRAVDQRMPVAEHLLEPPMKLPPAEPLDKGALRRPRGLRAPVPKSDASQRSAPPPLPEDEFECALRLGHLRRDEPGGAFTILDRRRADPSFDSARLAGDAEQLRIALEERGQQVILRYLKGEQSPPEREEFERAEKDFQSALELAPAAPFNESRMLFCRGRALIFLQRYDEALAALKAATRIDPARAYAYNAIGIAHLEQAARNPSYLSLAEAAFHDAIRFAPYWPYPWHNLALVATERGDFESAVADYRHAMEIAADYPYLPYNLGLLFQRVNRLEDAHHYYEIALQFAARGRASGVLAHPDGRQPEEALVSNALGTLAATRNKRSEAETYYRQALRQDPENRSARYNLATLLTAGDRSSPEAEDLWKKNLKDDPHHLTSRLAYARYLAKVRNWPEAVAQYKLALIEAPGLAVIYSELSGALFANGQPGDSLAMAEKGLAVTPRDPELLEQLGDAHAALHQVKAAIAAYEQAEDAIDSRTKPSLRQRIKAKKRALTVGSPAPPKG